MSTIRDVARAAGVSPTTVSHVINETRHVSPDTRARVLSAMAELNYQPNRLARSLRNRQTHTFGVLLPNNTNPFFAEVLLGIESACFDGGYNIILGNANDDPDRELFYLDVLLSKQVDGILLVSTGAYRAALDLIARHNTPAIMADRSPGSSSSDNLDAAPLETIIDTVMTDNESGGLLAVRRLLDYGHRRIGCITGPSKLTPSASRVTGYRRALDEAGLAIDEALIVGGDFSHHSGYEATRRLLALPQPPTAIFVCNDLMAIGALRAVHEAGLGVPADLSIIGYDDIPLAAYTVPRLTTIHQPGQQMGRAATDLLLQRLQDPTAPSRHMRLAVSLVERDSCGLLLKETQR